MSINKSDIEITDILCEFFEVVIHSILHIRNLYPSEIFRKAKKYGVIVYQSTHPLLNEYIVKCLEAIRFHLQSNQLKSISVCILLEHNIIEKYVFDINCSKSNEVEDFYVNLEQNLRDFCLKLHTSNSYLDPLPIEASFIVQLCTSEYRFLEFNENPLYSDFPWIQVNSKDLFDANVIPLHTVDTNLVKLHCFIEKSKDSK